MRSFKDWFYLTEDKFGDSDKKDKSKQEKENYLDGMWRELGIQPNMLPDYIESGPIELEDEGLWFNQAIWQIVKPIDLKDSYVRIKFHKSLSPNLDQRCYVRKENGQMMPVTSNIDGKIFLITLNKLAKILGKPWQSVGNAAGGPDLGGLGGP